MVEKKKPSSPRLKTVLAGFSIILGVTIICFGIFFEIFWYNLADVGCRPYYSNFQQGTLSGELTTGQPESSTNLTRVNSITILRLVSENDIPVVLAITNSNNDVFLNITHPHPLTQNFRSFTLKAYFMNYSNDTITITIQRTTNDTTITLYYEAFSVGMLCVDSWPPTYIILTGIIIGIILIGIGFRTLDKVAQQASWY